MSTIYLMRHGAVDNPDGIFYPASKPLSEQGRAQVAKTALRLQDAGVMPLRIISSPHVRTRETAEIVSDYFDDADVLTDVRLQEWIVNSWIGKPFEDFYTHLGWNDGVREKTDFPSDIESYPAVAERVVSAIRDTLSVSDGALLISHGEPIACAAAFLQNQSWIFVRKNRIDLADVWKFEFDDMTGKCVVTPVT